MGLLPQGAWTPPEPTCRPHHTWGSRGSQDRALELPPPCCDLGQAPLPAFSSHFKRPHNQKRKSR